MAFHEGDQNITLFDGTELDEFLHNLPEYQLWIRPKPTKTYIVAKNVCHERQEASRRQFREDGLLLLLGGCL
jgi:hypothetical protein